MKTSRTARIMSAALIYSQGLLVVAALSAVVLRLPADQPQVAADKQVVAAIATDTIAR